MTRSRSLQKKSAITSNTVAVGEEVPYAGGWLPLLGHVLAVRKFMKDARFLRSFRASSAEGRLRENLLPLAWRADGAAKCVPVWVSLEVVVLELFVLTEHH